jgi:hypothetical protein
MRFRKVTRILLAPLRGSPAATVDPAISLSRQIARRYFWLMRLECGAAFNIGYAR